jgi:hypothetical protein
MTTPAEKVALDVMFAALNGVTDGKKPRDAVAVKLSMLLGMITIVCNDHGIPLTLATDMLQHRWNDYEQRFEVKHDA